MRRKALLAVLCWLTLSEASGETTKITKNTVAIDNESAESIPKLYQNNQFSLYASGSPYGAYTFQQPAFTSAPKPAASQLVPIKEHGFVIQKSNGFLKDSYGNKFVETPQSVAYKTTFPQQFVQLQDLPSHLSQPLVAASPNFRNTPQYFFGSSPFRSQAIQATPTPITYFSGHSNPLVYADSIKSFAPSFGFHTRVHPINQQQANAQQQSTNNKAVFANTHPVEVFSNIKNGPKFQRLGGPEVHIIQENRDGPKHQSIQHENEQASPAQLTKVIANNNGEKTVTLIETNPPLPLLDLSLLEPLTFDNPIVPQVQHFLPKIHQVTYSKLPDINLNEAKRHQNEVIVQNTRSYDSGIIKPQNELPKKKENRPPIEDDDDDTPVHPKPKVVVTGNPEGNEFSYEINSPNHKEIYNEQVIKYNKETQKEPVTYDYNHKTESKPVHYSFVRNSKEPEQIREIHYKNDGQNPKHLIYNFKPEDQRDEDEGSHGHPPAQQKETEHSEEHRESSAESDEEEPSYHPKQIEYQEEAPRHTQHLKAEHREEEYHHEPNYNEGPRHSNNHQEGYKQDPKVEIYQEVTHHPSPQHYPQPVKTPQHNTQTHFQPIIQHEYEEDIRLIPAHPSNAPLKVDPGQHIIHKHQNHQPSSPPQNHPEQRAPLQQQDNPPEHHPRQHPPNAHVHEKSKQIIIQEESPDEMHSLREQMMAEVVNQEENNEEDFEKAYKDAAFGFPGYEKQSEEAEKDIYNPESYGAPRYNNDYDIEHTPFQQYQEEGDGFPKMTRSNYKDIRDKNKQEYYQEYEVRKPESITDRYKKKEDYYKRYMKHRPEKYFAKENDEKNQHKSKYTAVPNYEYFAESKPKPKQQLSHYKAAPRQTYEYDYSKGNPRDSSAHASRPYQRYKSKTHFVEPQFQYGFEPVSLPRLLDSELAAMASNDSPESEKPGTRKKLYKENWYIKKTSTSGVKPAS